MSLQVPYVPVLEKFVCCSLRTGSLILGWLALICSSCKLILVIMIYFNLQQPFLDVFEEAYIIKTINIHVPFMGGIIRCINWLISNPRFFVASLSIAGFLCTIEFIFTIFLLSGIHNKKPSEMRPYLLCSIFSLMSTLFDGMVIGVYSTVDSFYLGITFITIAFLTSLIFLYLWSVLYSYYRELEDEQSGNLKYKQYNDEKIAL